MQEEERRKALLSVQRFENRILYLPVNEIEIQWVATANRLDECIEEVMSNRLDECPWSPLRIVSLDERNLDSRDGRHLARRVAEHPGECRVVSLHATNSSWLNSGSGLRYR
ncbi:hypothetical protein D9M72_598650 [compost metagenome]